MGIAYTPFFPLGGFGQLQSSALSDAASKLGATPLQVALAWLLQRSPNILLIRVRPRSRTCARMSKAQCSHCRRMCSQRYRRSVPDRSERSRFQTRCTQGEFAMELTRFCTLELAAQTVMMAGRTIAFLASVCGAQVESMCPQHPHLSRRHAVTRSERASLYVANLADCGRDHRALGSVAGSDCHRPLAVGDAT
jgi:hypothetical protein